MDDPKDEKGADFSYHHRGRVPLLGWFWIPVADNKKTRKAASEKSREQLDVAFYPKFGGREICASLGKVLRAFKNLNLFLTPRKLMFF